MTVTAGQQDIAKAARTAGELAIADAVEAASGRYAADALARDLAAIIDRIAPENRVRETQIAALIVGKFSRHLQGLALKLEAEHGAGPMASKMVRSVIDAVGACGAQLNAKARAAGE